ncbi:hypothetical protein [Bacillus sp. SRB3LM]|uniref:hypothetical protein n=1 Tax=Bacillus sp. SRB3LM TaxID=2608689 RepID=UPI0018C41397|nr:hypothetical protein [Bacillus sp. SRB3LM]MBG0969235.1 hypothetical protein [Bacillus sp. SRB3LM]MBG0971082.1 hypothetical protein [Bacillus sp. SRB3LM]MBG0971982.1 hypothetical protein [Bacillus sp. SRB3LM]MBG0972004.1 hypothetical protein [Bacillus sp. SRB3LM]
MGTISATTSFADSYQSKKRVSSENPFQGYLVKNGGKTLLPEEQNNVAMNQEQIPVPQLSANPYDPIPKQGTTVNEFGNIGDVLYFNDGTYMEKSEHGLIIIGKYSQTNTYRMLDLGKTISFTAKCNQDPEFAKQVQSFWTETKVKRATKFKRVVYSTQPVTTLYTFNQAVQSGLSIENALHFAFTMGWKTDMKALLDGAIATLSELLTATYHHPITVTEEVSHTQNIPIGVDNSSYGYTEYTAAVYQIHSVYTVEPGAALQKYLQDNHLALQQTQFEYLNSSILIIQTPGSYKTDS